MKNMLITGGAGFIGANFIHYCREYLKNINITVIDALTYAGSKQSIDCYENDNGFLFVHGDICDEPLVQRLIRDNNIDTIIHFAAESHVDRSIHGPDAFIRTNIFGTYNLLKCAKKFWLDDKSHTSGHRFHHISTDEVYGSLDFGGQLFNERFPYNPSSPYSASKAASDHLVQAWHRTYGLNTTISNCSNNYGPYHYPEKLIPLAILNVLHGRQVPIYGKGINVRDWLYVTDHCRGIDLILQDGVPGETYNIGGLSELSNLEVIKMLCASIDEIFGQVPSLADRYPDCPSAKGVLSDTLINFVEDRPGHDLRYAMDISKIRSELGFEPYESLHTGLIKTVRWYIDNEKWWRNILSGSYSDWLRVQYG